MTTTTNKQPLNKPSTNHRQPPGIPVAAFVVFGCYGLSYFTAGRFENKKKHKEMLDETSAFDQQLKLNLKDEYAKMKDAGLVKKDYVNFRIKRPADEKTSSSAPYQHPERFSELDFIPLAPQPKKLEGLKSHA